MLANKVRILERGVRRGSNKEDGIQISLNEIPFPIYIGDFHELEDKLKTLELNRYPTPQDVQKVERLAAEYLNCPFTKVCLGNGLDDVLFRLMLVYRGKKLGLVEPGFPCYEIYAKKVGVDVIKTTLSENFELIDHAIEELINAEPDLIILAYPNNPTGNCFDREMILHLLNNLPHTVMIIDEAYYDFSKQTMIDLLEEYPERLACIRSLSKGRGLAGVRIGFMAGPEWLVKAIKDYELPFHFNTFMLKVAEAALYSSDTVLIDEICDQRELIAHKLGNHSFLKLYPSQANFFWCKELGPEGWMRERFEKYAIKVKTYSGWPGYYRFCIGTPEENEKLLMALTAIKGV